MHTGIPIRKPAHPHLVHHLIPKALGDFADVHAHLHTVYQRGNSLVSLLCQLISIPLPFGHRHLFHLLLCIFLLCPFLCSCSVIPNFPSLLLCSNLVQPQVVNLVRELLLHPCKALSCMHTGIPIRKPAHPHLVHHLIPKALGDFADVHAHLHTVYQRGNSLVSLLCQLISLFLAPGSRSANLLL